MKLFSKKYYAIWVIKEQNKYNVIHKQKIKPTTQEVSHNDKTHLIEINDPIFIRGRKLFYFVDYLNGQLSLREKHKNIEPELLDSIISKQVLKQLTSNLLPKRFDEMFIYIGLGVLIGTLLGYIIGISGWFQS